MLEKIALRHHSENYARFINIFGLDTMRDEEFASRFFTLDPQVGIEHPVTKHGGILETVHAADIHSFKPGQYGKQFFEEQVEIWPAKVVIPEIQ